MVSLLMFLTEEFVHKEEIMIIKNIQYLREMDTAHEEYDYEEFETNPGLGKDRIIVTGPLYRLRNTNLFVAEGTYCNFDEETGWLEPDFGVSLL